MHMGKFNFDFIQLVAEWWSIFIDRKYLNSQDNIIYFMAAMFRLTNKYVLRGGIGHMAAKGNENVESLLMTATKIESISFKGMVQPNITFTPPQKIKPSSWENRFEKLAVDMMLNPQDYSKGYEVKSEKGYSSPLALTALKIFIRTLETAISYEIKRKVINAMEKTQDSLTDYQESFAKRNKEVFVDLLKQVNEVKRNSEEVIATINKSLEETMTSVTAFKNNIMKDINLNILKALSDAEKKVDKITILTAAYYKKKQKLENAKFFRGFLTRRFLKKAIKKIEHGEK